MLKFQRRGIFFAFLFGLLFALAMNSGVSAMEPTELTNQGAIVTLPGSDTALPIYYYSTGSSSDDKSSLNPCFVVVPQGTENVTIKKNPNITITYLSVLHSPYTIDDQFAADVGETYSVTVPATATRRASYQITYKIKLGAMNLSKYYNLYFVKEGDPNPFVTPDQQEIFEGESFTVTASDLGDPAQTVEWHCKTHNADDNSTVDTVLEDQTGDTLSLTAAQDAMDMGDLSGSIWPLRFYAVVGGATSNQVSVDVTETSVTGAKTFAISGWGGYAGSSQWLNVGATFGGAVADDTPVKFYLTATENGTADTAVDNTLVATTVADVPATATQTEKAMGFLVPADLTAGDYWVAIQLGSDEPFYRYEPFTVYDRAAAYIQAALDKMINYYATKGFYENGTYVGLSSWQDTGTDWKAWMLANYGYALDSELLAGADGKTYLDGLEKHFAYLEENGLSSSAKDGFRYVAGLTAMGANPRDFNGRNLVEDLINCAYNNDGTLKLDENGALKFGTDILAVSYLLLGAEISGATADEGYTDALKEAGIKAILPTVETSVNATDTSQIASTDFLAMMSYPLYFLQDNEKYGARITDAIGKMADMVSTYQYADGGLTMNWPGAKSAGSYDDVIDADQYGANPNSIAVMLNALMLFGTTAEDLEDDVWQEASGTLLTALLNQQMADGSMGFNGMSNDMATYQTLGALIELSTGKSCFVNAHDTYLSKYPDYKDSIVNPFIADGSAKRVSASEGELTFTSNEAGQVYVAVVDSGADAPTMDTSGNGVACVAGENTVNITDLSDRTAKDIYVQVKDEDGNLSKILTVSLDDWGEQPIEKMTDVPSDAWYYDNVAFVLKQGIFVGTSATTFDPQKNITRAQFVTILGRYAGNADTADGETVSTKFNDVDGTAYYASHVAWAVEKEIVQGTSAEEFSPNANITREDMVTMIFRYAEAMEIDLPDGSDQKAFDDDAKIASYARDAVYSLAKAGIIEGVGQNCFAPVNFATRAEAAAMMQRLVNYAQANHNS